MIVKTFELSKKENLNNSIFLLYGVNEGFKNQIIERYFIEGFKGNIERYEENEVLNNDDFISSLMNKSLFDNEKLIIISRLSDKILKIIEIILEKKISGIKLILNSKSLDKKSKLRNFFEKNNDCICIPVYLDTEITLSKIALEYLKQKNIPISNSNLNLIITKCNGDRKILFMELEKIEYYTKNGKKITSESISKLTNLIENHSISELVDSCLAKNKRKTISILVENNFSNEDCILITRIFLNKLKKILKLSTEYQNNKDIDLTISSANPPIFWKEKEIIKQQILNSNPEKIKKSLYKINNLELLIKKNYDNSINLITDFIFNQLSTRTNN